MKKRNKTQSSQTKTSRVMAAVLVLAMLVPIGSTLIGLAVTGVSDLKAGMADLESEYLRLEETLTDTGCPAKAARSIALEFQENRWTGIRNVYYLPTEAGESAVINTDRHMISAAVDGGRLVRIQVTDYYQNQHLLQAAGLSEEDSAAAAQWLYDRDAGILSDAENRNGDTVLTLPDGTFRLISENGTYRLETYEAGDDDAQANDEETETQN